MEYIFFSEDGYTISPCENVTENFQVLGTANSTNEREGSALYSRRAGEYDRTVYGSGRFLCVFGCYR